MTAVSPLPAPEPLAAKAGPGPALQRPPHNLQAEAAIIGAVLYNNNNLQRISGLVEPRDFYAPVHYDLFEAASTIISRGGVADGITLDERFSQHEALTEVGGPAYLKRLVELAALGPEVADYARMVRSLAIRRELIDISAGMQARAMQPDPDEDGRQQVERAERELLELAKRGDTSKGLIAFKHSVRGALAVAEAAFKREGSIAGLATDLVDLDEKLGGMHPSDLLILAGRPSMGKSSLAINIGYNCAARCRREEQPDGTLKTVEGAVVGFFSLEMSDEQLAMRILSDRTGISGHAIRQGDLQRADFDKLAAAAHELETLPFYTDATGGISISELTARARRMHRSRGLDLLIIDYLQLITASGLGSNSNRVQEVTQITMALKALAKELNIPVLALAQLSRQVEQRDDKRPQLSDLRESGSIEQDADVVMFVFREQYYLEREEPATDGSAESAEKFNRWQQRCEESYGKAEVIIGKQRHGPIGKVLLAFDSNTTKFGNLAHGERRP